MKKSTVIIFTIIFLILFIAFSVFYGKVYKPAHQKEETSSLFIADAMDRQKTGNRVLLAELPDDDFQLYQDGGYVILVHGGQEKEFNNWSRVIGDEKPLLYYTDFDGDDKKELIVRALEGTDDKTGENYYCVYILFITEDEEGKYNYNVLFANSSTWYEIFDSAINYNVTQPTLNLKRIQFVMQQKGLSIAYDPNTGIVQNSRAWYVKSLSDGKNNYYTLKDWYLGPVVIDVDTEEKCLRIHMNLYLTYNETDKIQIGGRLNCGLSVKDGEFDVTNRSVNFFTYEEYRVSGLLKLAEEDWKYTFNNADTAASSKNISKTSFKCTIQNDTGSETTIFSGTTDEAKAISRIELTKNTMKLYAKRDCKFDEKTINSLKYSVTIKSDDVDVDITLSASVGEENGVSVLTFILDKDYPQKELKDFTVTIG